MICTANKFISLDDFRTIFLTIDVHETTIEMHLHACKAYHEYVIEGMQRTSLHNDGSSIMFHTSTSSLRRLHKTALHECIHPCPIKPESNRTELCVARLGLRKVYSRWDAALLLLNVCYVGDQSHWVRCTDYECFCITPIPCRNVSHFVVRAHTISSWKKMAYFFSPGPTSSIRGWQFFFRA